MNGTSTNISIRMDSELKSAAEELYSELGMTLSTAFNIFVRQSLREGGIPFKITVDTPSKKTVASLLEAERISKDSSIPSFDSVDELMNDLNK